MTRNTSRSVFRDGSLASPIPLRAKVQPSILSLRKTTGRYSLLTFWIESVGDEEVAWFNVGGEKAIKITLYFGWSWVEWGGVGLARLQFWLQNAGFGLLGKDGVLVTH